MRDRHGGRPLRSCLLSSPDPSFRVRVGPRAKTMGFRRRHLYHNSKFSRERSSKDVLSKKTRAIVFFFSKRKTHKWEKTTRSRGSGGPARSWSARAWRNLQHTKLWWQRREGSWPPRRRRSALGKGRQRKRSGACDGPPIRAILSRKTQWKGW